MELNTTEDTMYSSAEKVIIGVVLYVLVLISIGGNILVIVSVLVVERLHRVANMFIVSLAVADLMVSVFVMPFNANFITSGTWHFGLAFCSVYQSFDILACTSSILSLCVIAVDRYLAITSPFTYTQKITRSSATILIALVWLVSFLISVLPVILDFHEDPEAKAAGLYNDQYFCVLILSGRFAVISSLVSFYLPMVVMVFIYARIFAVARKQARQIAAYDKPSNEGNRTNMARERKAAKTLGIIMGVFIACWLPFFIANIIDPFCNRCISPKLFDVFVWLGYVNSTLNPLIYAQNSEFRRAYKYILGCYPCRGLHIRNVEMDISDIEATRHENIPTKMAISISRKNAQDANKTTMETKCNGREPTTGNHDSMANNNDMASINNKNNVGLFPHDMKEGALIVHRRYSEKGFENHALDLNPENIQLNK
ncbi:beta-2 adrenergic receptor-like [Anneissia japonica]|uniref:beta-2 adrenergic receptor-like n=1 Tax=Anneissia japonica TaxID=1529436 RepID=UPI0014257CBF|nr:beta-2 adrenergic receptor-like [Anneissia japonica]XP_033102956.1 beta-2 adrenergic receptor-like [Anneissia japonica]